MLKSKVSTKSNKLSVNGDDKDMKMLVQKYGNYLVVDNHKQSVHSDAHS